MASSPWWCGTRRCSPAASSAPWTRSCPWSPWWSRPGSVITASYCHGLSTKTFCLRCSLHYLETQNITTVNITVAQQASSIGVAVSHNSRFCQISRYQVSRDSAEYCEAVWPGHRPAAALWQPSLLTSDRLDMWTSDFLRSNTTTQPLDNYSSEQVSWLRITLILSIFHFS